MAIELIFALQLTLILFIVCVMMLLIIRRQKKTLAQLTAILSDVKNDLSGDSLLKHLQRELDNTTAHCRQDTIALKKDLNEEDMAITLRYHALNYESTIAKQVLEGSKISWREQIQLYTELAQNITEFNKEQIKHAAQLHNEVHQEEIAKKDQEIEKLEGEIQGLFRRVTKLEPLESCINQAMDDTKSRAELEKTLHKSLLAICDSFQDSGNLRELVFLMHEAFYEINADATQQPDVDPPKEASQ